MNRRAFLLSTTALVAPGAMQASCLTEFADNINRGTGKLLAGVKNETVRTALKFGGVFVAVGVTAVAVGLTARVSILAGVTVGTVAETAPHIAKVQHRGLEFLDAAMDAL